MRGEASGPPGEEGGTASIEGRRRSSRGSHDTTAPHRRPNGSAARLGHEYVGTKHLLLGLLGAAGEAVAPLLAGRQPAAMAAEVERRVRPESPAAQGMEDLPYTSRAKRILELAVDEARQLGHEGLLPEHVLLGLLREEGGLGGQMLREAGLELEASRIAVAAASAGAFSSRRPTLARRLLGRIGHWTRRGRRG